MWSRVAVVLVSLTASCHAGLLGAGYGEGSCAAAPFRTNAGSLKWPLGCPEGNECCSEFGYCKSKSQWLAGNFRDCNGVSNGRPLEPAAIAAENAAAARGDTSAAGLLVVPAGATGYGAAPAAAAASGYGYGAASSAAASAAGSGYGYGLNGGIAGNALGGAGLVAYSNGAVVPVDEPSVAAARAAHLASISGAGGAGGAYGGAAGAYGGAAGSYGGAFGAAGAYGGAAGAYGGAAGGYGGAAGAYGGAAGAYGAAGVSRLVTYPNGAVVPSYVPAVAAARAAHLAAF